MGKNLINNKSKYTMGGENISQDLIVLAPSPQFFEGIGSSRNFILKDLGQLVANLRFSDLLTALHFQPFGFQYLDFSNKTNNHMSTSSHMYEVTQLSTYIKKILSSLCRFSFLIGLISGISGAPTNQPSMFPERRKALKSGRGKL